MKRATENKTSLPKYTNYHVYAVIDKNLFRKPDVIKSDRSHSDVKKNCAFYKDIGNNIEKCIAPRDKIERLIQVGYFKEFLENEPQVANMNERPRQRSLERIREGLTIFGGPHVVG